MMIVKTVHIYLPIKALLKNLNKSGLKGGRFMVINDPASKQSS